MLVCCRWRVVELEGRAQLAVLGFAPVYIGLLGVQQVVPKVRYKKRERKRILKRRCGAGVQKVAAKMRLKDRGKG
jgi:hypothetical protein